MKKKTSLVFLLVCVLSILGGCQKTPEKKDIIQKSTSVMLAKEESNQKTITEAAKEIEKELGRTKFRYLKNAEVDVKNVKKLPIYRTRSIDFTQEQADRFLQVVAGDDAFYKMDTSWDKNTYRKKINELKDEMSGMNLGDTRYEKTDKTYNEVLEEYKRGYANARDKDKKEIASKHFVKTVDNGQSIFGYVIKEDGTKRMIKVCNRSYVNSALYPTQMCFSDDIAGDGRTDYTEFNLFGKERNCKKKDVNLSMESARKQADEMIKKLGIENFRWDGETTLMCHPEEETYDSSYNSNLYGQPLHCAYSFTYTRQVDGVALSVPSEIKQSFVPFFLDSVVPEGNDSEEARKEYGEIVPVLDYEVINILVNDKGVVQFMYNAPFQIEETVVKDAKLLSASELLEASATYLTNYANSSKPIKYNVKKLQMAYQRISEEFKDDTTLLVPVWKMQGDKDDMETIETSEGKMIRVGKASKDVAIMILNAVDGSGIITENAKG